MYKLDLVLATAILDWLLVPYGCVDKKEPRVPFSCLVRQSSVTKYLVVE